MATQEDLWDSTELAREILVALKQKFAQGEPVEIPENLVDELRVVLEPHLDKYNEKHRQKCSSYEKLLEESNEMTASLNRQIKALKLGEKERTDQEVARAVSVFKDRLSEVTRTADKEREEIEKEKDRIAETQQKAKSEIDRSRREARQAVEEREKTIKLLREKEEAVDELESKVKLLESTMERVRGEALGWKGETNATVELKESTRRQRDASRSEIQTLKEQNRELQRKRDDVAAKLERALETIKTQDIEIQDLDSMYRDVSEELQRYKLDPSAAAYSGDNKTPLWKTVQEELRSMTARSDTTGSSGATAGSFELVEEKMKQIESLECDIADQRDRIRDLEAQLEAAGDRRTAKLDEQGQQAGITDEEQEQKLSDCDAERRRLEAKVRRLESELQTLQDAADEQARVISSNEEQAKRTREALDAQIAVFDAAQRELGQSIEAMVQAAVSEGRSAAETSRELRVAHRAIERNNDLIQALTLQRDQQDDVARLSFEARQRARQRAGAAPVGPGVWPGDGHGRGRTGLAEDTRNFFVRAYDLLLAILQYGLVWGALAAVFGMMVAVMVAEGRQFAKWKYVNAESRAQWIALGERPTVCLGMPNLAGSAIGLLALGRWAFR
ncbi:hypothetical protein F5B17DRAFT_385618 [Nemania serpens]|nr:hypothetical protein F5B17DRAFT_385618 [Nemania serpens]